MRRFSSAGLRQLRTCVRGFLESMKGWRAPLELTEAFALGRDLGLRWPALPPHVGVRMVEGRGMEGAEGRYALPTILPPAASRATLRRDLTILLDTSGSMHGIPLELAKEVVDGLLGSLGASDRMELLAFGSTVRAVMARLGV